MATANDNIVGGVQSCTVEGYGKLPVSDTARVSLNKFTKSVSMGVTGDMEVSLAPRPQFIEVNVTDRASFDIEAMVNDVSGLTVILRHRNGITRTLIGSLVEGDPDLDAITGKGGALRFVGPDLTVRRP